MLLEQKIKVKWATLNKKHYESLGYSYTKLGNELIVDVNDLPKGSVTKVKVSCDYCFEDGRSTIFERIYQKYINTRKKAKVKKDACKLCIHKLKKEVFLIHYGVSSPMKLDKFKAKSKSKNRRRFSIEEVKEKFEERNYTLLSTEYIGMHKKLNYICIKHPDKPRSICMHSFLNGCGCAQCGIERKTGSNNVNWQGSKQLYEYCRGIIVDWKKDSLKKYNYKCIISGVKSNQLHIHHLISFTSILNDCLRETGLPMYEEISKYSEEELMKFRTLFIEKHNDLLGVPIMPLYHYEFHRRYGKGNNTLEQFKEFLNDFKGETNICLIAH